MVSIFLSILKMNIGEEFRTLWTAFQGGQLRTVVDMLQELQSSQNSEIRTLATDRLNGRISASTFYDRLFIVDPGDNPQVAANAGLILTVEIGILALYVLHPDIINWFAE